MKKSTLIVGLLIQFSILSFNLYAEINTNENCII